MNGMPVSVEGEGTPIHWGCSMFVVLLVAAGLALYLFTGRADPEDIECLENMVRISNGAAESGLICPVVEQPYRSEEEGERRSVFCPDPASHLEYHPRFVREDGRWLFQAEFPEFSRGQEQTFQLRTTLKEMQVEENADGVRIQVRGAWYYRFLLGPVLVLFGALLAFVSGGFAIGIYHSHAKAAREATTPKDAAAELAGGLTSALPLAAVTILSVMFVITQAQSFLRVREVVFSKDDSSLRIQDSYPGRMPSEPRAIRNVEAVYPFAARRQQEVIVIYQENGEVKHETLFAVSPDDAGLVRIFLQAEQGS